HVLAQDKVTRERIPSDIPAWSFGWSADYPDAQDFLSLQFASGQFYNASWASDPTFDTAVGKADIEVDPAKRSSAYNEAEQIITNDVAWIPFQQDIFYWRQRAWVRGFGLNSLQQIADVRWASVAILEH